MYLEKRGRRMYRNCVTEKTVRQQLALEKALIELLEERDLDKISVVEICERAGITRRIFYRLYETKQDCLVAAIDHKLKGSGYYKSKTGHTGFYETLEYVLEERDFFTALCRTNNMGLFMERTVAYLNDWKRHERHIKAVYGSNDPELLLFNVSGFIGVILYWVHTSFARDISVMADLMNKMIKTADYDN